MQRAICFRTFAPALPEYPVASVRDYCAGALARREVLARGAFLTLVREVTAPAVSRGGLSATHGSRPPGRRPRLRMCFSVEAGPPSRTGTNTLKSKANC